MAEPPSATACSTGHLSVMQLFYELKQKFPTAPDPVVSECIRQSGHDPKKCEALLRASCASRGFFPASPTSAVVGRRRFSAPSAAGAAATPPCNVLQSSSSRERSATGRNSMCALPERSSPTPIQHPPPQQQQQSSVNAVDSVELCDSATPSALRAKLRPTFLNTRPFLSNRRNSNPFIDNSSDLRPPFLGGPLQEPHKFNRRRSSTSTTTKEESSEETQGFYTSETYKCSVNTQTRVQDWLPCSREPTPPPRPPLPSNMVQEPILPPPFSTSSRYFHEEDFFQDYEVSVNCGAHGVHVTSTCSSPISGPVGSPIFPQQPSLRHTASLHVHPTPHYLPRPSSGEPRSYTSVNLTLRPATCEPQPPIDIRSATSRLTYSTSSYNPIQGFQSQLHIEIGAGCGTISAVRTAAANNVSSVTSPVHSGAGGSVKQHQVLVRTVSPSTPDKQLVFPHQQAGLARQMERKAKLENELRREKERLRIMRSEVHTLKDDLNKRQARKAIAPLKGPQQTTSQRAEQLRIEIRNLQDECKRMTQEVDLHGSQVPLGETDEEFYQNIYTGQRGFVLPPQNLTHPFQGSFTMPSPLPVRSNNINSSSSRPAPRPAGLNVAPGEEEEEEEDGPHWTCSVCTFRNHPALSKCEQCEMPRISLGTDSRAPLVPSSGCFCHPPKLTLPSPTLVHTGGQAVTPAVTLTPPPTGAKPVTSYTPSPTGARPLSSFTPSPTTSRHAPPFTPSPNRVLPASATPSPTGARPVLSFTPSPTGARPIPPPRRPSPVPPVPTAATGSTSPS